MESKILNTVLIEDADDKKDNNQNEEETGEDIFETIFNEIKENTKNENKEETKMEEKESNQQEAKKELKVSKDCKDLDDFVIVGDKDENKDDKEKNNSDVDDF